MLDLQTIAAIIFVIVLTLFLYLNRKKLDTKFLVPYFLYFSMYKTKLGLKFMDYCAGKHRKLMVYIGYFGIFIGFLGMIVISYGLLNNIYVLFTKPHAAPGVGLVLPFKAKGVFYVPFFYWIISIFVIAVVHEFSHGLIARAHKIKVKSSGFAFLGVIIPIIPAAFVEPDEKELKKRPHKEQLSVFAAGPLANIAAAFLFVAIAALILSPMINNVVEPNGVKIADYVKGSDKFPAENAGMKIGEVINQVDSKPILYISNLSDALKNKKPGDFATITTNKSTYSLKLAANPENQSAAYLGAYLEQSTKINDDIKAKYGEFLPNALIWIYGLVVILVILNFGIGVFNLVPIGPLDGGRMLQLPLHKYFGQEKGNKILAYVSLVFFIIIVVNIGAGFGLFKLFN